MGFKYKLTTNANRGPKSMFHKMQKYIYTAQQQSQY